MNVIRVKLTTIKIMEAGNKARIITGLKPQSVTIGQLFVEPPSDDSPRPHGAIKPWRVIPRDIFSGQANPKTDRGDWELLKQCKHRWVFASVEDSDSSKV